MQTGQTDGPHPAPCVFPVQTLHLPDFRYSADPATTIFFSSPRLCVVNRSLGQIPIPALSRWGGLSRISKRPEVGWYRDRGVIFTLELALAWPWSGRTNRQIDRAPLYYDEIALCQNRQNFCDRGYCTE